MSIGIRVQAKAVVAASLAVAFALGTLTGCASAPKPPVVDGKNRQPINSSQTVAQLAARSGQHPSPQELAKVVVSFRSGETAFRPSVEAAEMLKKNLPLATRIEIKARNDAMTSGNPDADYAMAYARGTSAKEWLVGQGATGDKIFIDALGTGDYVSDNQTAEGRANNRRVEIRLLQSTSM